MPTEPAKKTNALLFYIVIALLIVLLVGAGWYGFKTHKRLMENLALYTKTTQSLKAQVSTLKGQVATAEQLTEHYKERYEEKAEITNKLQDKVSEITNTVSDIKDFTSTDPELLEKYSKVYFLNENYRPQQLKIIPIKYNFDENKEMLLRAKVLPFFKDMMAEAKDDGNPLEVISAYRSFGQQEALKTDYVKTYGSTAANSFSADQGYSEHQLGSTLDLTTPKLGASFDYFDKTQAYQWMLDNAYKYGFILSYPKGNGYYEYEPWHWRFVGIDLATDLHKAGDYFYEWPQRKLDAYRGKIWDTDYTHTDTSTDD